MTDVSASPAEQPPRPPQSPALEAAEHALRAVAEAEDAAPADLAPRLAAAHQALASLLDDEPPAQPEQP